MVKHQLQVNVLKALGAAGIEFVSPVFTLVRYSGDRAWEEIA